MITSKAETSAPDITVAQLRTSILAMEIAISRAIEQAVNEFASSTGVIPTGFTITPDTVDLTTHNDPVKKIMLRWRTAAHVDITAGMVRILERGARA